MKKNDTILWYLSTFTQCCDELGGVDVIVPKEDLVALSLLGLPKSWHSYQDFMNGRDKLPSWERLWSDLVQEEIRWNTRDGTSSKGEDEENCALDRKAKKAKGKKSKSKADSSQGARRKTCPESSAFTVMNSGTMQRSVHTRRQARRA